MKNELFERIRQIAKIMGFKSIPRLSAYMGYGSAEKFYRLKRDPGAKPAYQMIEDFTNKFEDLNIRWLISGKGEILMKGNNYAGVPKPPKGKEKAKKG